jgi:hypothetical protein
VEAQRNITMNTSKQVCDPDRYVQLGFEAALNELRHQAIHLEERGAYGSAMTLYDAIRIARTGGLPCERHSASR